MDHESIRHLTRRHFFGLQAKGIGIAALASLFGQEARAARVGGLPDIPHFAPKAKRVIYLFQSGGPSQIELFDYKPRLSEFQGTDLPESVRQGQRLTAMSATQAAFPVVPSKFQFAQHGQSGAWVSELLPHTAKIVDQLTIVKSVHTEAINHDPAVTFFQTGSQIAGRPSMGAWVSYGLGCETQDLPAFVVMISPGQGGMRASRSTIACGAAAFCPRDFRASSSARPAIRCCTSPTRQGFPAENRQTYLEAVERDQRRESRGVRRSGDRHPDRAI